MYYLIKNYSVFSNWFCSTNHKIIGVLYLFFGLWVAFLATFMFVFIRYWGFQDVYKGILMLLALKTYHIYVLLLSDSQYYVVNCFGVPHVLTLGYTNKLLDVYSFSFMWIMFSHTESIIGLGTLKAR